MHRGLTGAAKEAERLQNIANLGFDTNEYQRLSRAIQTFTGDAASARAVVDDLVSVTSQIRRSFQFDPSRITRDMHLGFARLNTTAAAFADMDFRGQIDHLARNIRGMNRDMAAASLEAIGFGENTTAAVLEASDALTESIRQQDKQGKSLAKGTTAYDQYLARLNQDVLLSERAQKRAIAYNQTIQDIKDELSEARFTFFENAGPALIRVAQRLVPVAERFSAWIKDNEQVIDQTLSIAGNILLILTNVEKITKGPGPIRDMYLFAKGIAQFFESAADAWRFLSGQRTPVQSGIENAPPGIRPKSLLSPSSNRGPGQYETDLGSARERAARAFPQSSNRGPGHPSNLSVTNNFNFDGAENEQVIADRVLENINTSLQAQPAGY